MATITLRHSHQEQTTVTQEECGICREELYDKQPGSIATRVHSDPVIIGGSVQNTYHLFHRNCINQWAESGSQQNHGTCPTCRHVYGRVEHYQYDEATGEYNQVVITSDSVNRVALASEGINQNQLPNDPVANWQENVQRVNRRQLALIAAVFFITHVLPILICLLLLL